MLAAASVASVVTTAAHAKTAETVVVVTVEVVMTVEAVIAHPAKTVPHVKSVPLVAISQSKCLSRLNSTAKCVPSSVTLVPIPVAQTTAVEIAAIVAVVN